MNVSLVAGGLVFIIGAVLSRRKTLSITLFCLTLYAALSGLEPSIVRASLMGSLLLIAGLVGRQYLGLWMLLLTGYGMLFVDPRLLFDVGFQLSFLATAGIVLIKPLLLIPLPQILSVVREDFSTTLSAQILTIPILLSTFGQFNLISILANVAILWMILPVMVLGGLGVIASFFFSP